MVDQQALTGESLPVVRAVDDHVFAATVVQRRQDLRQAERVGRDTKAASTVRLIEGAPIAETRIQNHAEMVADRLVAPRSAALRSCTSRPPTSTGLAAIPPSISGRPAGVGADDGAGLDERRRAARDPDQGRRLPREARARLHGDLRQDGHAHARRRPRSPTLVSRRALASARPSRFAAAASARQTHPVSHAVTAARAAAWASRSPSARARSYFGSAGASSPGWAAGGPAREPRFLAELGITDRLDHPSGARSTARPSRCSSSPSTASTWRRCLPRHPPREPRLIRDLRARGVDDIVMLTGDGRAVAEHVARELGIDQLLRGDVARGQGGDGAAASSGEGRVVACRRRHHDSPALSYADIGISVCAGAEIAREMAALC